MTHAFISLEFVCLAGKILTTNFIINLQSLKTYIWLQCFDGSIQQVEEEVAMFCPMICREIVKNGTGSSKNHAIALPERVNPSSLSLILDYCRFHQVPGRSNKVPYVLTSWPLHFTLFYCFPFFCIFNPWTSSKFRLLYTVFVSLLIT